MYNTLLQKNGNSEWSHNGLHSFSMWEMSPLSKEKDIGVEFPINKTWPSKQHITIRYLNIRRIKRANNKKRTTNIT